MGRLPIPRLLAVGLGLIAWLVAFAVTARIGRPLARLDRAVADAMVAHRTVGGVDVVLIITDTSRSGPGIGQADRHVDRHDFT